MHEQCSLIQIQHIFDKNEENPAMRIKIYTSHKFYAVWNAKVNRLKIKKKEKQNNNPKFT